MIAKVRGILIRDPLTRKNGGWDHGRLAPALKRRSLTRNVCSREHFRDNLLAP